MFEIPEVMTLTRQMNEALRGKIIRRGQLGNSPHKFVWFNRTHPEFEQLTAGKRVGQAHARGRWLLLDIEEGYVLVLGEWGGRILYHQPGSPLPAKYHLYLQFEDGSFLTATTQMWGAAELYEKGLEMQRQYIKDMKPTPLDGSFSFPYFSDLIDELAKEKKQSVKGLLTQDQTIPGLGNSIAQDIMYAARLHPRRDIQTLAQEERQALYRAIVDTVTECAQKGGRNDEFDLFNQAGGYRRIMDKNTAGQPCPSCAAIVEKAQYLGGAIYYCPVCQK